MMKKISPSVLEKSMNYEEYRQLIDGLIAQNKTTGDNHSEAMLNYTKLNISRMRRLDKTTRLTEETLARLAKLNQPLTWLVITEAWCGDAAQIIPVMEKMKIANSNIDIRYILRDENLGIMDAFLTDGARSIPKLLVLKNDSLEVLRTWGPRPEEVQTMVMDAKKELSEMTDAAQKAERDKATKYDVQLWYAKDKTKKVQEEILRIL